MSGCPKLYCIAKLSVPLLGVVHTSGLPVVMIRRRNFRWHEDVIDVRSCLNTFLLSALICRIKTAPPFYYGRGPILGFCIFYDGAAYFLDHTIKRRQIFFLALTPMIAASGFSICPKLLKCLSLQAAFAGPVKVPTQRLAYSLFVSLETY